MTLTRNFKKRKVSGGRYIKSRKKKVRDTAGRPTLTLLGQVKRKLTRSRSSNIKARLLLTDLANVYNPKTKKYQKSKIKMVLENPANRHFVRRNIITRGTIIDTELGKARVTSRPGQEGSINAILI